MPRDIRLIVFVLAALTACIGVVEDLTRPICRKSRVQYAVKGAAAVAQAAELARNFDDDSRYCPTLAELVASRHLGQTQTYDPWGKPYRVDCSSGDARGWSDGSDGVRDTDDDLSDRMARPALQRAMVADRPWYRL